MITREEFKRALEVLNGGGEFDMVHPILGAVTVKNECGEIGVYIGKQYGQSNGIEPIYLWGDRIELGNGAFSIWMGNSSVASIPFDGLEWKDDGLIAKDDK